jgi:parallel beta helix pectate lyase-like protein
MNDRRRRLDALAAPQRRLNLTFFLVIAVMAGHEAEHVAQVIQKDAALEGCPGNCRGLLGFIFDVEWIHFLYNSSLFLALVGLFVGYRMWDPAWRRAALVPWFFLTAGIAIQAYHVVEHVVKLDQWFANGHVSPTPGLIGQLLPAPHQTNFALIELHFVFNTVVFVCVVVGYFGLRFHRQLGLERMRLGWAPAAVAVVPLVASAGIAWAAKTPVTHLSAGVHQGPIVLDSARQLVGEDGAVVRGGILVTANDVSIRNLTVVGGEHGITVEGAKNVNIDNVTVTGAHLDGFHIRRAAVNIRDCVVHSLRSPYAQSIDISFVADLPPSLIEGCTLRGGQEGIATHFANLRIADNRISGTKLRGIGVSEMSMASVEDNQVENAIGAAIYCGDYSHCDISDNVVRGTRPDPASGDLSRMGYDVVAHFWAIAKLKGNELGRGRTAGFVRADVQADD